MGLEKIVSGNTRSITCDLKRKHGLFVFWSLETAVSSSCCNLVGDLAVAQAILTLGKLGGAEGWREGDGLIVHT